MNDDRIREILARLLSGTLSRRDFIRIHGGSVLAAAAGIPLLRPTLACAANQPDIAVATGAPGAAVRAAVDMLGGISSFVRKGSRVVIKPNMSFARGPASATNTSPEVVHELVALCRQAGASRIRVLDHPLRPEDLCIKDIRDACSMYGDDIVHAFNDRSFYREVSIPKGRSLKSTEVMKEVLDADVLIAAPVAKSHGSTGVSLSMKGMMGLIWSRGVLHYLHDLSQTIVDMCTILKPQLVVIDGIRVLSTNGPGGPGKVMKMDTIIASRDMVAADAQATTLFEWYGRHMEPRQVKHIRYAHEQGFGRMDIEALSVQKKSV